MNQETEIRIARLEMAVNNLKGKHTRWKVFRALMFAAYVVVLVYGAIWFLQRELDRRTNRPVVQEMVELEVM